MSAPSQGARLDNVDKGRRPARPNSPSSANRPHSGGGRGPAPYGRGGCVLRGERIALFTCQAIFCAEVTLPSMSKLDLQRGSPSRWPVWCAVWMRHVISHGSENILGAAELLSSLTDTFIGPAGGRGGVGGASYAQAGAGTAPGAWAAGPPQPQAATDANANKPAIPAPATVPPSKGELLQLFWHASAASRPTTRRGQQLLPHRSGLSCCCRSVQDRGVFSSLTKASSRMVPPEHAVADTAAATNATETQETSVRNAEARFEAPATVRQLHSWRSIENEEFRADGSRNLTLWHVSCFILPSRGAHKQQRIESAPSLRGSEVHHQPKRSMIVNPRLITFLPRHLLQPAPSAAPNSSSAAPSQAQVRDGRCQSGREACTV